MDRVQGSCLLMPFQEGPHRNCSLKQKTKFFKQGGKLDYSRYSQVYLLTLCYHWQTLSTSNEMVIAKDHYPSLQLFTYSVSI